MKFLFSNGTVSHLLSIKDSLILYDLQVRNYGFLTHGAHRLRIIFGELQEQIYECGFLCINLEKNNSKQLIKEYQNKH